MKEQILSQRVIQLFKKIEIVCSWLYKYILYKSKERTLYNTWIIHSVILEMNYSFLGIEYGIISSNSQ